MDEMFITEDLFKGIDLPDEVKKHFSIALISFAQIHVTRALQFAADKFIYEDQKRAILTAYPLENIT